MSNQVEVTHMLDCVEFKITNFRAIYTDSNEIVITYKNGQKVKYIYKNLHISNPFMNVVNDDYTIVRFSKMIIGPEKVVNKKDQCICF